jgi:hypothetical protein
MKKLVNGLFGFVIATGIAVFSVSAQENHAIRVEKEIMTGDVIHLTYEIRPVEKIRFFNVILEPVSGGQKINVAEAYGNLGHRQQSGKNEIVWYVRKDFSGDISKLDIRIYAFAENEPRALAKVVSVSNNATAPCEVVFANNSQYADQVEWDFGDVESGASNHSSLENPSHTYTKSGIYTTRLTARNTGLRMEETWIYTIEVLEPVAPVDIPEMVTPEVPVVKKEEPVMATEPEQKAIIVINPEELKYKKAKLIWLGSAAVTAGVSGFSFLTASSAYRDYTRSVDNEEAIALRKKFKTHDIVSPVALIVSGICISQVIIQAGKQKRAKKNLEITAIPLQKGGMACLTLKF